MTRLIITRGYSGSGKTTLAKELVAEAHARGGIMARANRDDLRAMMGIPPRGTHDQEQRVTRVQRASVEALLRAGSDVIVDDTNLVLRFARDWADLAAELGVDFEVLEVCTPARECIRRDDARHARGERSVGEKVISSQAERFPFSQWRQVTRRDEKPEASWTPYAAPDGPGFFESIYLVDIDGTIAKKRQGPGTRGWHDYARVGEDLPNPGVIDLVSDLKYAGHKVVFMSGRKSYCREQTTRWLRDYVGSWVVTSPLFMRADDDNRSDDIVKHELFHEHIQGKYDVRGVIDDRDRVVAMWRAIGLTVAQVDYGNF